MYVYGCSWLREFVQCRVRICRVAVTRRKSGGVRNLHMFIEPIIKASEWIGGFLGYTKKWYREPWACSTSRCTPRRFPAPASAGRKWRIWGATTLREQRFGLHFPINSFISSLLLTTPAFIRLGTYYAECFWSACFLPARSSPAMTLLEFSFKIANARNQQKVALGRMFLIIRFLAFYLT